MVSHWVRKILYLDNHTTRNTNEDFMTRTRTRTNRVDKSDIKLSPDIKLSRTASITMAMDVK